METSAKWYFDTLPFHPQPKYLESFCSYVLRIVEGNNIGGIGALCSLSFPGSYRNIYRKFTDYPLSSFSSLIMTTGCQDSLLLATTFYHLGKKFGRTPQPRSMRGFMGESIARYLRFCPMCLHDMHIQYYSLKWRFLQVLGCTEHNCKLLDRCGHCGLNIPLFTLDSRVGICPSCSRELRLCSTQPMAPEGKHANNSFLRDIEFLLSPHQCDEIKGIEKLIGSVIASIRRSKQLKRSEIANMSGISETIIKGIEQGDARSASPRFYGYIQYINTLGSSLKDVFSTALMQYEKVLREDVEEKAGSSVRKQPKITEDELVYRVEEAVRTLQVLDEPILQQTISEMVGITISHLRYYPRVRLLLDIATDERKTKSLQLFDQYENALVGHVQDAIQQLRSAGEPVVQRRISDLNLAQIRLQIIAYLGEA